MARAGSAMRFCDSGEVKNGAGPGKCFTLLLEAATTDIEFATTLRPAGSMVKETDGSGGDAV